MCVRIKSEYYGYNFEAHRQKRFLESFYKLHPIEYDLLDNFFENKYGMIPEYIFGEKKPHHTGHHHVVLFIYKNNIIAFLVLDEGGFGYDFGGKFTSHYEIKIVNFPNSILLTDIL